MRDRLVCGLRASHIQKRLLSEPKLTYKRALETALSMEVAAKDTLQMTTLPPDEAATEEVHQMEPRQPTQRKQGSRACYRCGSPTHLAPACPHLETVCRACGKKGHLAPVCRSKSRKTSTTAQAKFVSECQVEEPVDEATVLTIGPNRTPPITIQLELAGQEVQMEVDTGASVSLMPSHQWLSLQLGTTLEQTQCVLRTYTGEVIPTCGKLKVLVEVKHMNQTKKLPLLIVEGSGPALLGRNWLKELQLDWHNIHALQTDQWQSSLQEILLHHGAVFQPGLGTMKAVATITLSPGSVPKFLKYRTVPYAIQESVEEELARMEREGVLERVDLRSKERWYSASLWRLQSYHQPVYGSG